MRPVAATAGRRIRLLSGSVLLLAVSIPGVSARGYDGRRCTPPTGYRIADCRVAEHGTPDLSRTAWRTLFGEEVTISARVDGLAPDPAAGGAPDWPLIDSLGQPIGHLVGGPSGRFTLVSLAGTGYHATAVNLRGHGCAASATQSTGFPLVQVIAGKAPSGGTQGFIDAAALGTSSAADTAALHAFASQLGGGTGCGPAGAEISPPRPLADPRVGASAHARLSNGRLNTVTEYDAKPAFGDIVYFSSNTTEVSVGGVARGMVRVGTPVAKVDTFTYCDPNSDGTLIWRYWSIHTGDPANPRLYGWIPGRCPASARRLSHQVKPLD
ncbi:MAG TPA: hypothetical protein VG165_14400 [Solirubrobacteraceae bacterium]|nr:hypothetical protein [Solirubrobacteraceae bacterium]